jgi:hypothetical protein
MTAVPESPSSSRRSVALGVAGLLIDPPRTYPRLFIFGTPHCLHLNMRTIRARVKTARRAQKIKPDVAKLPRGRVLMAQRSDLTVNAREQAPPWASRFRKVCFRSARCLFPKRPSWRLLMSSRRCSRLPFYLLGGGHLVKHSSRD